MEAIRMLKRATELRYNLVRHKDSKYEVLRRRAHVELDRWLMTHRMNAIELVIEGLQRQRTPIWKRLRGMWPAHKYVCTACAKEFANSKPIYKVVDIVCCSYECWLKTIKKDESV